MVCIHCGAETHVTNSRPQKRLNQVWRRRRCDDCGAIFTTEEVAQYTTSWAVLDTAGHIRAFNRDKLFLSIYGSLQHRATALADATALTDTVIKKLGNHVREGVIIGSHLAQTVQVALNRFDKAASVHYQAFHSAN
ncbi:MAG TPA: hypothetical protein VF401_02370 [Candidatus Saccharimonadales bacterium]